MSKMTDLQIQIQELLDAGHQPQEVAVMLDVPVSWVYETEEGACHETESHNVYLQIRPSYQKR
jgi:hypothetical protein